MLIGLAQINTIVGDLPGNRKRILEAYNGLVKAGAELVVFPELVVCGYPPRDLLNRSRFVKDTEASLESIAEDVGEVPAVLGTVVRNTTGAGRPHFNAAAFCVGGRVMKVGYKSLLPTYDVFDEDRYFEPGSEPMVVEFKGQRIGVTICEDIWTHPSVETRRLYRGADAVSRLEGAHCDLMLNLSASPFHNGKGKQRERIVGDCAKRLGCPVVYCNAIGGNDELVFDGRSMVCDAAGRVIGGLKAFAEDIALVDTEGQPGKLASSFDQEELADVHDALVLGLKDYAHKSGFKRALVALSGGIDSALVAVLAAEAFGVENVTGISLPSAISSQHSRDDARILAENLGMRFETIAIEGMVMQAELALAPVFAGRAKDVAEENIQARARGVLMMALSNKFGSLLLTTGNKSEVAVGYCTLYGDMCGGLAVISDVFKMQVYALSRWINEQAVRQGRVPPIPQNTIDKAPSAELRPDQRDSDSLPPYPVLDAILLHYVEKDDSRDAIIAMGFPPAIVDRVIRLTDIAEYKRRQGPLGVKITPKAFGKDRRMPITNRFGG